MDGTEHDAELHEALQNAQTQIDAEILQVRSVQLNNIDIHMQLCKAQMDGGNSDETITAARHQLRSCQIALALLHSSYNDMKKVLTGLANVHVTEASLEDSKDAVQIACNVACMTRRWAADEYALCKQQIAAAEKAIESRMHD
jgi:chaperone required for assembly of F1-ATPase